MNTNLDRGPIADERRRKAWIITMLERRRRRREDGEYDGETDQTDYEEKPASLAQWLGAIVAILLMVGLLALMILKAG